MRDGEESVGGGGVGRRTPLDQYSTHIASAGGLLQGTASRAKGKRWRPREDHTDIESKRRQLFFLVL